MGARVDKVAEIWRQVGVVGKVGWVGVVDFLDVGAGCGREDRVVSD